VVEEDAAALKLVLAALNDLLPKQLASGGRTLCFDSGWGDGASVGGRGPELAAWMADSGLRAPHR